MASYDGTKSELLGLLGVNQECMATPLPKNLLGGATMTPAKPLAKASKALSAIRHSRFNWTVWRITGGVCIGCSIVSVVMKGNVAIAGILGAVALLAFSICGTMLAGKLDEQPSDPYDQSASR